MWTHRLLQTPRKTDDSIFAVNNKKTADEKCYPDSWKRDPPGRKCG